MKTLKFILLIFALYLVFNEGMILAQKETMSISVAESVKMDEDVQPQQLEIQQPTLLPDSSFYFLKNWARGIQEVVTFNPVKRVELKLKVANEKLMEMKAMAKKTNEPELLEKATENYQQEMEKVKQKAQKIKQTAQESPEVNKFMDKFVSQQILHQKLLQKLESQVPTQALAKIQEARETHLENFKDVMLKLEDKEKISERLEKVLEAQRGSEFKDFKNLEVLKSLEEKMPEAAKTAIQQAQVTIREKLKEKIERMEAPKAEQLKSYIQKISGDSEKQLEVIEDMKVEVKEEFRNGLEEGQTKLLENINLEKGINCPALAWGPGYCKEGRFVVEKIPETGCYMPKCVEFEKIANPPGPTTPVGPGPILGPTGPETKTPSTKACIEVWKPVCGKDGKTYSNACFAKLAGVGIDYNGTCPEKVEVRKNETLCKTDSDCACGIHIRTKECFFGNEKYVDESKQCPDFCSGFTGQKRIKCVENQCKHVGI